ncbi:multiple sugar transport system substrate-binding protein [Dyadobacter jejuensis]|uniref:Multiple sugar transport system substrate-binding protein n=1 Tax=Dyadobacter jejuensis TaxID=1082580 RepID=A0A316AMI9_9BACT|nr:extracellular solute-binding protein [Dyadobacter jejuensis]PWJ58010.1 multiple sugar transport system substrate-binding protein [Dyadobacter jejuensis]
MDQQKIRLKGITWDHSRGYTSIVAVAQRFHELNPQVEIVWEKRSLQAFADEPIDQLASRYDLLIIDHPWTGYDARTGVIFSLNSLLSSEFLDDQATHSVGKSHESYSYDGRQWALAIDAATPVAASRPDLLAKSNLELPQTWEQLTGLAQKGLVAIPGIPQDTLMSFYMVCSTLGEDVCTGEERVVSEEVGLQALNRLRELGAYIDPICFDMNPIKVYEAMTTSDRYAYSPFAYGYSNYSKKGYASELLKFHDLVAIAGQKLITTLGGTGLSISASCQYPEIAAQFLRFAGCEFTQSGLYFESGGQPGHRKAWLSKGVNSQCLDYFKDTLPALDRSFLRPRYHGHMQFQDHAGRPIQQYMQFGGDAKAVLATLNKLYLDSLQPR